MKIGFILPDQSNPWLGVHQGIGYVAAYLVRNLSIKECDVFRTHGSGEKDLVDFLSRKWDVLGVSLCVTSQAALDESRGIVEMARSLGPAKIVVGGPEVTTDEEGVFATIPGIDFAIPGEGEVTCAELLECLKNRGDFSRVKGLVYRDDCGNIRKNEARPFEPDLEVFPYPDRTLFRYGYDLHTIIGTRGCPYRCTFCNSSANWRFSYRLRNPKTVAEEIRYTIGLYGNRKYWEFNDDSFNIKKRWVIDLCREIKDLKIKWFVRGLRAGLVTEEIADCLVEAGCFGASCGVESANNDALKAMRKATTIEEIMRGVELLQSRGIRVNGQFMIGNQGDTLQTVKESIECARRFSDATFSLAYPIKRTQLAEFVEKESRMFPHAVPVEHDGRTVGWIYFDTPWFPLKDQLEAVRLTIEEGLYQNMASERKFIKKVGRLIFSMYFSDNRVFRGLARCIIESYYFLRKSLAHFRTVGA